MSDNFKTLIVANPQSAGGTLTRKWTQVSAVIRQEFGAFDHRFTSGPGDASRITREALREGSHEMVVAMGGDGTISEVVDGFFDGEQPINPEAALGALHYGTGGDFRKSIHASKKLAVGARQLRGRETGLVDVGRLRFVGNRGEDLLRHYINIASFGISGLVDKYVNESSKRLGGTLSFALATLKAMSRYSRQRVRLTLDDLPPREVKIQTVAVANGKYFGGGMQIAPDATLDDGEFDVVVLGLSSAQMLVHGSRVYKGSHRRLKGVTIDRCKRLVAEPIDPNEAVLLDVDGETPGRLPATFEVLPLALRLKTPGPIKG